MATFNVLLLLLGPTECHCPINTSTVLLVPSPGTRGRIKALLEQHVQFRYASSASSDSGDVTLARWSELLPTEEETLPATWPPCCMK